MSYLKIYQKDLYIILGFASILPVVCFVGGVYTGSLSQARQSDSGPASTAPLAKTDISISGGSEMGYLATGQVESGSGDGSREYSGRSVKYAGEIIEYGAESHHPDSVQVDITDTRALATTDGRQPEAANVENNERADVAHVLPNITPLQSFNAYLVQAGRFSSYENAAKYQAKLATRNLTAQIAVEEHFKQPAFLIIINSFASKEEAKRYCLAAEELYQLDFYVKAQELGINKVNKGIASL